MELFYRFSVVVAIVSTLALSSCTDDVYDPERGIQTKPKENPLGEDFTAPDGFDWSLVNTVNLNVEINDEFDGRYKYLIEIFTANPISEFIRRRISAWLSPCPSRNMSLEQRIRAYCRSR